VTIATISHCDQLVGELPSCERVDSFCVKVTHPFPNTHTTAPTSATFVATNPLSVLLSPEIFLMESFAC
jgi:hypothetical protein